MSEFRTIDGANGLSAHELGRFGERTGGWRIERKGAGAICEVPSEVDARILLSLLGVVPNIQWTLAAIGALEDMGKEAA